MPRIQLIHWNATEAKERAEHLKAAGYEVIHELPNGMALFRMHNSKNTSITKETGRYV